MRKIIKYSLWLLIPVLLLFALIRLIEPGLVQHYTAQSVATRLQQDIQQKERNIKSFLSAHPVIKDQDFSQLPEEESRRLFSQDFHLYLYRHDSLALWTSNEALPPVFMMNAPDGSYAVKLKNGWFDMLKSTPETNDTSSYYIAVFPIKYAYEIHNKYLEDHFDLDANIPVSLELSPIPDSTSIGISNINGRTLCYVSLNKLKATSHPQWVLIVLECIMLIFLLVWAFCIAESIASRTNPWLATLWLLIFAFALRVLLPYILAGTGLLATELFDPRIFASTGWSTSLGYLIINLVLLCSALLYFYQAHQYPLSGKRFMLLVAIPLAFGFQWILDQQIRQLLIDSVISYDISNFFSLDRMSFAGFFALMLLLLAYFLITYKLLRIALKKLELRWWMALLPLPFALVFIALESWQHHDGFYWITAGWTYAWILFNIFYMKARSGLRNAPALISVIGLFAILSALYIDHFNHEKDMLRAENVARKLADDRDYVAEYTFTDVHCRITDDQTVRAAFNNPLLNRKSIFDRIKPLYFKGYLGKFDIDVHAFDTHGRSIIPGDSLHIDPFKQKVKTYGYETSDVYLYFLESPTGNFYYTALVPVLQDTGQVGTLAVELRPRPYNPANVYPELLLSKGIQRPDAERDLNYAVYVNENISRSKGIFPYNQSNAFPSPVASDQFILHQAPDYDHLIYRASANKVVVVSLPHSKWLGLVSLFSYLFSFLFIFTAILYAFYFLLKAVVLNHGTLFQQFDFTFRDRISITLLSILIFSFIAVGVITTWYFTVQYDEGHKQLLLRKEKEVQDGIGEELRQQELNIKTDKDLKDFLSFIVPSLADNQGTDINVYDAHGNLLISSQPSIFEKNLISAKMDPAAFWKLGSGKVSQVMQNEQIGKLSYISAYTPLVGPGNKVIGYLNLPYFAKAQNLKEDISRFLVALVNVYVPLLLFTSIIGLFISNSITNPLTEIGEKLRKVRLGKRNEPIQWHRKDEIGLLVEEYNKMITKLEESATSMAKSEREGAWREMAKQIAHEIKNPLTPMKLSIQYLQRAMSENHADTREMTLRMTRTLIEQIDSLSEIATAFSSFAKMPTPNNEVLDLDHYVKAVVDLFKDDEKHQIHYHSHVSPANVFVDRSQMISVFNNLIKNAVQSIPEDRVGVIEVILQEEFGHIKVMVMDNGSGIPEDIREKVFVPNFTTKNSGTGLGLAITRQIIETAGGTINFESVEGKGTTFYITLPAYYEPQADENEALNDE